MRHREGLDRLLPAALLFKHTGGRRFVVFVKGTLTETRQYGCGASSGFR